MTTRDFTYRRYNDLLLRLSEHYISLPLTNIIDPKSNSHTVHIRHDVDRAPGHALTMAKMEREHAVCSTYYFRDCPQSLDAAIIQEISSWGHAIGYHYENLAEACLRLRFPKAVIRRIHNHLMPLLFDALDCKSTLKTRSNPEMMDTGDTKLNLLISRLFDTAIMDFERSLNKLRKLAPIHTISMHGRPGIPIDNRYLWLKYDYRDFGLELEPYFDLNYDQMLYITDAGRIWNDPHANKRDKVSSSITQTYNNSEEIINAISNGTMHPNIVINIHPEHWTDSPMWWWKTHADRKLRNFLKRRMLG